MFDNELEPQKQPKKLRVLDDMSIDELEAYIQEMKDEIARVEADIKKKKAHKDAISSMFK